MILKKRRRRRMVATEHFYQTLHKQLGLGCLCQTGCGNILQRLELPSTVVLKRHETADLVVPVSNQKSTSCLSLWNLREKERWRYVTLQQAATLNLKAVRTTETNWTQATNTHNWINSNMQMGRNLNLYIYINKWYDPPLNCFKKYMTLPRGQS